MLGKYLWMIIKLILLIFLIRPNYSYVSTFKKISKLTKIYSTPWWSLKENGLSFKCTGCGKCCQNEGEVWMDANEYSELSSYLNISPSDLYQTFTEKIIGGWAKMKNHVDEKFGKPDKCIFLGEDGKSCQIYKARPNQCRTYPWYIN